MRCTSLSIKHYQVEKHERSSIRKIRFASAFIALHILCAFRKHFVMNETGFSIHFLCEMEVKLFCRENMANTNRLA